MPGRCAAPPAPAMMTSRPRARAPRGVLEQQVRRAVRRDHAHLVRHAELVERVGRALHRLPVGSRAHDDSDEGLHTGILRVGGVGCERCRAGRRNSSRAAAGGRARGRLGAGARRAARAAGRRRARAPLRRARRSRGSPSASSRSRQASMRWNSRDLEPDLERARLERRPARARGRPCASILPMYWRWRAAAPCAGEPAGEVDRVPAASRAAATPRVAWSAAPTSSSPRSCRAAGVPLALRSCSGARRVSGSSSRAAMAHPSPRMRGPIRRCPGAPCSRPRPRRMPISRPSSSVASPRHAPPGPPRPTSASADTGLSVGVRLGEVETLEYQRDRSMGITVYVGKRKGSATTARLLPDAVAAPSPRPCRIARFTAEDACAGLAGSRHARARRARSRPVPSLGPRGRGAHRDRQALRGGGARSRSAHQQLRGCDASAATARCVSTATRSASSAAIPTTSLQRQLRRLGGQGEEHAARLLVHGLARLARPSRTSRPSGAQARRRTVAAPRRARAPDDAARRCCSCPSSRAA